MATIVRWSPWRELESMQQRMRRMFGDLEVSPATLPAADVFETDDEFVVEVEVPGFDEKEVSVELSDHTLTVKGEREERQEKKERSFWSRERLESSFERRFELPVDTDTDKVSASFANGVLEVHLPRAAQAPPRKVEIRS